MSGSAAQPTNLLAPDALSGVDVGISASASPDFERLGLIEAHFKLALGEIARSVLVAGGKLTYGGHLDPGGYTAFLLQELHRYGRRDRPLRVCLAWPEHRRLRLQDLAGIEKELGLLGKIVSLDASGTTIDPSDGRTDDPASVDPQTYSNSLTALREHIIGSVNGLVLIGGKRADFQGTMPGVIEEALLALKSGLPLYLAGGFGGATADIIKALGVDDCSWFPVRPDAKPADERLRTALEQITEHSKNNSWQGLNNGLSVEENRRLAATHRPSEIAALVSLGLGRRLGSRLS